jgi:hypothetical protein
VDAQTISIAAGVVSAAIAAIGLLLSWYRREDYKDEKEKNSRNRLFITASTCILVVAAVAVVFTFRLSSGTENSAKKFEIPTSSTQLTDVQYRGQLGAICSDATEKARQLEDTDPQKAVFGVTLRIEEDELSQVRKLQPPGQVEESS